MALATWRERLRAVLQSHATGRALLAWRIRGQAEALLASRGLRAPGAQLADRLQHRVARGPFAGMLYPRRRGDIVHAAKLLGTYESELHPALERLLERAPTRVVNVGSGDGYYVVGIARRLPTAQLIAVDPDPLAQRACAATAARNGVAGRVTPRVRLDAAGLQAELGPHRCLCVVDCEGFEDDLLDPVAAPALAAADLLVETHDFAREGVTARLTARFAATHDIARIELAARDVAAVAAAVPAFAALVADRDARVGAGLLEEFRHRPQSWLVCTSRAWTPQASERP